MMEMGQSAAIAGFEDGKVPRVMILRRTLETGKGKRLNSHLELPEGTQCY